MFYDLNNKTILKYALDVDLNSLGKHESSLRYNAVITLKSVKIHTIKRLDEYIVRIKGDLEYVVRVNGTAKQQKHPLNMKVYSKHDIEDKEYFEQKLTPFEEDTVQVNEHLKVVTSKDLLERMEKDNIYNNMLESYEKYTDISEGNLKDLNISYKAYF